MKRLGILWLVVFISLVGFGITIIPFPFVAERMGASDFWKAFGGSGMFSLFQFMAIPFWGRCSDAFGRKPILITSLFGTVFSFVWLAYADTLTSLLVARALGGIMSGNLAAAFAYATDVTDTEDRAKGLGIVASAFGIGFAVGPPLGGVLGTIGSEASLHWPALVSAALALLALLGTLLFLPESLPVASRRPLRAPKTEVGSPDGAPVAPRLSAIAAFRAKPVLIGLAVSSLLVATGSGALQAVFQFWGRDRFGYDLREIGLHFMVLALFSALGQAGLIGPLTRRFGEKPVAVFAVIGASISLVIFALAVNDAMVWSALVLYGIANGLFLPSVSSLVSFEAEADSRGAVMGMFNASSSAGRIIGPAIAGPIYFNVGSSAPFWISAVIAALGAIFLSRAHARPAS